MSRVLLADDHDLVRDTLAAYLRSEGGFDVAVAGRFDDALAMVRAQDGFDLVLLDYRMPGMAALAGLARMREQAGCPVAILSGTAPPEVARRALRAGAAGFLPKTLAPRALISAVRRILEGDTFAPCDARPRHGPGLRRLPARRAMWQTVRTRPRSAASHARCAPSASPRTNSSTSATGRPAAISPTMAEPTTQPSATPAMVCAVSGLRMPKPTITGRSVCALIRATSGPTSVASAAAAPVIPVIDT